MYAENYKNTFLVDVLEYFGLVKIGYIFSSQPSAVSSKSCDKENYDIEAEAANDSDINKQEASETEKDPFIIDWNGPEDPENPLNWSSKRKAFIVIQIMLLTCVTYMGASIYTPGQDSIQEEFHVGHVVGTLNLSMYVLGYGLGPMIFSPLSEVASIGRQRIYIITLFLFTMFQIGCATVQNIAGLVIIRFISGVLCSPSLATGAGTIGDMIAPEAVPVFIGLWAMGSFAAPVIAPLLGAAMVVAEGWRFIFWLLMWLSAATLILLVVFFPETQHANILHRRAERIRKETGDERYYTVQERIDAEIHIKEFALDILYRPFAIMVLEPAVLAFDIYIALCYGTFYLFFEAFPLVFVGIYDFTLIELGLAFMGFSVGCVLAYIILLVFLTKFIAPRFKNNKFVPEHFLVLAMWVCWSLPLSLFLFGWAAGVHWILPIISEIFFVVTVFNLFQSSFSYLAISYPRYLASVFAGNSFCRSVFASAFPLFGQAMYKNLGSDKYPVGWGSSLVGFFCVALAAVPFIFYKIGPALRGKSHYAN